MSYDIVCWKDGNDGEYYDYIRSSWAVDEDKTKYLWPKINNKFKVKNIVDQCQWPSVDTDF